MRDDLLRLLSGSVLGRLTPEERRQLLQAALDDQEVFQELADQEPLRELLLDPALQAELLASLAPAPAASEEVRDVRAHQLDSTPMPQPLRGVLVLALFAALVLAAALRAC